MKTQLIDIGINLTHKQFDIDRENIIDLAKKDNITPLIIIGTNIFKAYYKRYCKMFE